MTEKPRVQVIIRPTAALLAVVMLAAAAGLTLIHQIVADDGEQQILSAGWHLVLTIAVWLPTMLLHEMGHVLAYRVCGLTWTHLVIKHTFAVRAAGERTYYHHLVIGLAGPFAEVVVGVALVLASGNVRTLLGLVGAAAAVNGSLQLVLPLGDGGNIYRSLWAIVRGRGRHLVGRSEDPT